MKKNILGILLALCMIVGIVPVSAAAQGAGADTWDGTADTSWYDDAQTEFEISTAEQLAGLAVLVNGTKEGEYKDYKTFAGKTVRLAADLDLSGYEWVSIGSGANVSAKAFCGTFDGQGHTIAGLYSHEDYISDDPNKSEHNTIRTGLFGAVYHGTIQNLGVIDADILISGKDSSTYGMGIIADWFTGSNMYHCYSSGSITGGSGVEKYIGGLIGFGNGDITIQGCYSQATITGNYTNSEGYYSNPMLYWDSLGGIIGASYTGKTTINDCWFDGKIVVNAIQAPVGGIIGYGEDALLHNCLVATTDIDNDGQGNTFWLGYEFYNPAANCVYPNDDTYGTNVANYPEEGEISAGLAVDRFDDGAVLNSLTENAADGITWVEGIHHPTFSWDKRNIPADYSKVDEAIAKVNALNKDEYKDFSAVEAAVAAVVRNKNITEQTVVDGYADAIEAAIEALEYKPADYSKVDEAIAKVNALNKDEYKDFSAVEAAVAAVVRDKNITEQTVVDGYVAAIEAAIEALEYKPADYSKVDEAIAKVNALNKDEYKDFSAVEAAVAAVVRDKNITEQTVVDGYAGAIEAAIEALEYKPADYSKVDEAIAKVNALNKDEYKDFSAVEAAVAAVVRDKNITEQEEVDAMAKAITDAASALEMKSDPDNPETGDSGKLLLWTALLLLSGAILTEAAVTGKKRRA